jgi:hypothetical protein
MADKFLLERIVPLKRGTAAQRAAKKLGEEEIEKGRSSSKSRCGAVLGGRRGLEPAACDIGFEGRVAFGPGSAIGGALEPASHP